MNTIWRRELALKVPQFKEPTKNGCGNSPSKLWQTTLKSRSTRQSRVSAHSGSEEGFMLAGSQKKKNSQQQKNEAVFTENKRYEKKLEQKTISQIRNVFFQ